MSLAQQGFAVVNFSYRLASKYKFPAPLEDTNRVFVWLLAHAVLYGFDTHNVFGVGDNAGVHLLALYGACCTNPAYAALFTVRPPAGFVPRAVVLNCGVYCVEMSNKKDLTTRLMADYLPGEGTAEELEQMDVFSHLTADFPPAFVMTAEGDFLAPQAGLLAERLQAVGARAEYHYCGDAGHVLGHVFHCNNGFASIAFGYPQRILGVNPKPPRPRKCYDFLNFGHFP